MNWKIVLRKSKITNLLNKVSCLAIGTILISLFSTNSYAHSQNKYYIDNLTAPDNFLAIRTLPSTQEGKRVTILQNGSIVDVLEKRSDGWWFIRDTATGLKGWAVSNYGNKQWIMCCVQISSIYSPTVETPPANGLIFPEQNSLLSRQIVDSVDTVESMIAHGYKISFLSVLYKNNNALAVIEITSEAGGGVFMLEQKCGEWHTLYMINGKGGSTSPRDAAIVTFKMTSKIREYNATIQFLPQRIWDDLNRGATGDYSDDPEAGGPLAEDYTKQ